MLQNGSLMRSAFADSERGESYGNGLHAVSSPEFFENLKIRIHRRLVESIDLTKLSDLEAERIKVEIRRILESMVMTESLPLSRLDRERLVTEIQDEAFGLGPIECLLKDPAVTDVLVNSSTQVYVERRGKLQKVDVRFRDDAHLLQIIDRIVTRVGRRIDESSPMVDARLPDGSRVNAIIPPLALDGPVLSIRRFGTNPLTMRDLVQFHTVPSEVVDVLALCVQARLNILVSGGTGAGKTTLLNCLSTFIPEGERIVTIEDSAELKLQQDHVVRMETRPPNVEDRGAITQRDLLRNALRMRPDRIIVGEVRGAEALDMLQAMNTGHEGSLSTIHANSGRDALSRLETMMLLSAANVPQPVLRAQIASAIDLVIQLSRLSDGSRRLIEVSEISGMEGDVVTMQTIFRFDQKTISKGKVVGNFIATGVRPKFLSRLERIGAQIPPTYFASRALGKEAS